MKKGSVGVAVLRESEQQERAGGARSATNDEAMAEREMMKISATDAV